MKSHLIIVPTADMTREQWLQYRMSGIGASEVGSIMGLDDYVSSLELFFYKIGDAPKMDVEKMAQFMGREQEDLIADMWQYWDGSEETMIANYRADKVVRKCRRINAFVRNPKFPWLYVSLDRVINKHAQREEGNLELKTITKWEADKWVGGMPVKWVTQVNTQMVVPEFDYGEIALLEDNRRFDVLPFEISATICEQILSRTKDFWDRVVTARKLVTEKYEAIRLFNQRRVDQLNQQIDKLAPEPDGSLAYADYLSQRYKMKVSNERRGTQQELIWARLHNMYTAQAKECQEKARRMESELKLAMAETTALDFGADGKLYWSKQQDRRVFRNKVRGSEDNPL